MTINIPSSIRVPKWLLGLIALVALLAATASSCDASNHREQHQVDKQQRAYNNSQPAPAFNSSAERGR